jgi:hypothetical protein
METRIEMLERRLEALELRLRSARRRARAATLAALAAAAGALALGTGPQARAQFGITLTSLHNRLLAVEARTQDMTRGPDPSTGQATVRFSGVNVQVVSGTGTTDGPVNGAGNLIVGYNERRGDGNDVRTGSHNLIVGQQHSYSAFGGLVAGILNTISANYASVSGGFRNTASGAAASVSGGVGNTASGDVASVSGGLSRSAPGAEDWAAGGLSEDF